MEMVCLSVSEFIGRATMTMEEIRRLPGSRQIIPLTSGVGSTTSGSVTIEVSDCLCYLIK